MPVPLISDQPDDQQSRYAQEALLVFMHTQDVVLVNGPVFNAIFDPSTDPALTISADDNTWLSATTSLDGFVAGQSNGLFYFRAADGTIGNYGGKSPWGSYGGVYHDLTEYVFTADALGNYGSDATHDTGYVAISTTPAMWSYGPYGWSFTPQHSDAYVGRTITDQLSGGNAWNGDSYSGNLTVGVSGEVHGSNPWQVASSAVQLFTKAGDAEAQMSASMHDTVQEASLLSNNNFFFGGKV